MNVLNIEQEFNLFWSVKLAFLQIDLILAMGRACVILEQFMYLAYQVKVECWLATYISIA